MTTEERLEKVEKELGKAKRQSRVMLVAVVMAAVGICLLGAGDNAIQKVIRAEAFVLVDSGGRPRATLSATDGEPGLWLCAQNGVPRVALSLDTAGRAGLWLYDASGEVRVALSLNTSGQPVLGLADQSGQSRVALGVPDSGPELDLYNQDGKVIWSKP